jgi:hypothetical protein
LTGRGSSPPCSGRRARLLGRSRQAETS